MTLRRRATLKRKRETPGKTESWQRKIKQVKSAGDFGVS